MQSVRLPLHVLSIILVVALQAAVSAHGEASKPRVNNTLQKLMDSVTLGGVREHQAAFQAIADANNGIRAAGSPGYDASVDYIVGLMSNGFFAVFSGTSL